jgi:IclR family transcriptional regulator, KDG regulon repressor
MFSQAGKIGPAYCTGVGKAMLAFSEPQRLSDLIAQQSFHRFTAKTLCSPKALMSELDAIRARGYAFDDEEHEPGIICIAMPISSAAGTVLGAVSVTSSTQRTSLSGLEAFAPQIREVARRIGQETESWRFPEEGRQTKKPGGNGHVGSEARTRQEEVW